MRFKKIISLLILFCSFTFVNAQEKSGPREQTFKQDLKSNKQLRKESREKRRKERAEKKAIKEHHKRLQTKNVRKRMKESRKSAIRHNENKRKPLFKRWFSR
jgi:predicted phage gp36 major capsid-like protein